MEIPACRLAEPIPRVELTGGGAGLGLVWGLGSSCTHAELAVSTRLGERITYSWELLTFQPEVAETIVELY